MRPTDKVTAASVAAAATVVASWVLRAAFGVEFDAETQGAVTFLAVAAAGWFTTERHPT